jgi:hypothetical protein
MPRPSVLAPATLVWFGLAAVNAGAEPIRWDSRPGGPAPGNVLSRPLDALAADLHLFGTADGRPTPLRRPCYVLDQVLADDAWYDGGPPSFPGPRNEMTLKLPRTPPPR